MRLFRIICAVTLGISGLVAVTDGIVLRAYADLEFGAATVVLLVVISLFVGAYYTWKS